MAQVAAINSGGVGPSSYPIEFYTEERGEVFLSNILVFFSLKFLNNRLTGGEVVV